MIQPLSVWKRRIKTYNIWEMALLTFIIGSLYLVNPDFVAFRMIRSARDSTLGALTSFIMDTKIVKVIRGDIKVSNVFDITSWNLQEVLSLLVTTILLVFFCNNILLDKLNDWRR